MRPNSGKSAKTAFSRSACSMSAMVRAPLNDGSATRSSGVPTATRIKPWL